ncbi:MAG: VCBS repeat-containing protein, partial [Flavobacteriales bacterium]|nr:VCBS repeat-containing protein [Flavobacteriales bacterium]
MKQFKHATLLIAIFVAMGSYAQVSFTNNGAALGAITGFSYEDCAVDMNGDHLDDVVRVVSSGIYIDFQQPGGTFTQQFFPLNVQNPPTWSICAADIDENGYTDLLFGNGSRVSFVYANDDGTAYTEVPFDEYIFSQRSTFADIDNDGNIDAFVCHDVDQSHPYRNVNGNMELDFDLIQTLDVGGNYAAIWCDYDNDWDQDLYITKCRGGAAVGDPQRINLLYQNNGDGTFSSVGPAANMDDGDQSWTTCFEDFDNDGDFDAFTVNHAWANRLMENNGDGTFTDIILGSGIDETDLGAWNCDAGDFDNNGFVDIFSEMGDEMYLNNGDGTFTGYSLSFNSGGIGDFNNDGFLDVINGSNLWINNGNDNNWLKVNCEGLISNKNGIGARIEIYGEWGIQIREIRSSESFSPGSSLGEHFGLGQATSIDQ